MVKVTEADFWEVMLAYRVVEPSGCWRWLGSVDKDGYATIKVDDRPVRFHEWSYRWHKGPIHPSSQVVHRCRNLTCGNPDHLVESGPAVMAQELKLLAV